MRTLSLAAAITISLSSISTLAQEALIEFTDGEIASAEDVNSNFKHLSNRLRAIEGKDGCYARDEDGSTIVECADGTSVTLESGEGRLDGISSNATAIETNAENVAANRADIDTNTANVVLNTQSIVANRADIDTNTANVVLNTQSIVANRADIDTNTANIATNRADIDFLMSAEYSGCSAAQDGSSVVITCADGSSGVLASAGTVIAYPEGLLGEAPLIEYNTGDIVLVDADSIVLGPAVSDAADEYELFQMTVFSDSYRKNRRLYVYNNPSESSVNVAASRSFNGTTTSRGYFLDESCMQDVFVPKNRSDLLELDGSIYAPSVADEVPVILFRSSRRSAFVNSNTGIKSPAGECEPMTATIEATLGIEYTPAPEILNAAYPVRLKQLP
jgi:hypothetical protein